MWERPALLLRDLGEWRTVDRAAHAPHLYDDEDVALVLHAPGDPKLGMVRAMEALRIDEVSTRPPNTGFTDVRWAGCRGWDEVSVAIAPDDMPFGDLARAWTAAHLLLQRGIAREVLVLP